MHRFAVAVVVIAVALAAPMKSTGQAIADRQFHVEMRDGTEIAIPSQSEATNGVIVEFIAPPAAMAARSAGKTAVEDYRATFTRFRADVATILNASRAGKSAIEPRIRREYFVIFNGVALDVPHEAIAQLRALPYVKRVVADLPVHMLADSANITIIGADKVWSSLGSRGKGVTVAIIDTGIDYMHPALGGGFGPAFKVIGGWDFVNDDADPFDDAGHGTHVAGIVAGQSDTITGVAPEASLIAYKVLGANGSGSESNVIAAIERAADPDGDGNTSDHVDVANLSLGGGGNPDDPASVAIDNATAAGVTFAIAAGNSGAFHRIASPGTARSAITVGASDLTDTITSFSSRGPNTKDLAIKPDVVAPGLAILSSYPGNRYATLSGTSMATPHVAGAAALLKSLHHDWTPAQIKLALMNNAKLMAGEIMAGGAGRIDVYAAATGNLVVDPPSISLGLAQRLPTRHLSSAA
jgi:subtilisin family serine protease